MASKSTERAHELGFATYRKQRDAVSKSRGFESYGEQSRLGYRQDKRAGVITETFNIKGPPALAEKRYKRATEIIKERGPGRVVQIKVPGPDGNMQSRKQVFAKELITIYPSIAAAESSTDWYHPKKDEDEEEEEEPDEDEESIFLSVPLP